MTQAVLACLLVLTGLALTPLGQPRPALAADATVTVCDEASFDAALAGVQSSGGGTITFGCSGTITFTGWKRIRTDVTIIGNGDVILDGNRKSVLFGVESGGRLALTEMTLQNGLNPNLFAGGGAIANVGTVEIRASTLRNNRASAGTGGAIANLGTLLVSDSTVSGNSSNFGAGAIDNRGGNVTIEASTFNGNDASDNQMGGAIFNSGTLSVLASTFSGNSAGRGGGAIYTFGGTTTVQSTILANSLSGGNCGISGGTFSSGGSNLSDDSTCNLTAPGDIENSDSVNLGQLVDNGGPTWTMLPLIGSAAINAADCALSSTTDQRGLLRSEDICDIGAVEVDVPEAGLRITAIELHPSPSEAGEEVALTAAFTNPGPNAGHSCTIDWGDESDSGGGSVDEQDGAGTCTGSHTYADIGDYMVTVSVMENAFGVTGSNSTEHLVGPAPITTCDEASFDAALAAAQAASAGTITFDCTGTIVFTSQKMITGDVTIIGNGQVIFDGAGSTRLFSVEFFGRLQLTGLTLQNGFVFYTSVNGAGAIRNLGTLSITDSTFTGNTARNGGAIFNKGTLSVMDSTFSGNGFLSNAGGAILNEGTLSITDSTFSGNASEEGGAIHNFHGSMAITTSNLIGNTAEVSGGAIHSSIGTVTITDSTFDNNAATGIPDYSYGVGGALFIRRSTVEITASAFSNNRSSLGGAILGDSGTLTVTASEFSNNSASPFDAFTGNGGAILHRGTLNVRASTFSGNTAVDGGALNIDGTLTVAASTFSGNVATGNIFGGRGGALISDGAGEITTSSFSGNSAGDGGAIYSTLGSLTVTASTINGNTASYNTTNGPAGEGGAIYNNLATLTVRSTILANSPAGGNCNNSRRFTSGGYNLSDDDTCNLNAVGDIENSSSVNLGPLADNGGPTQTMLPLDGSAALNAADCALSSTTDQRGLARIAETCDIGAVEVDGAIPVQIESVTNSGPVVQGQLVTITVAASGPNPGVSLIYEFDCANDGDYEISQVTDASAECTIDAAGNNVVSVRVSDGSTSATGQTTVVVLPTELAITALTLDPFSFSNEGDTVELAAAFADPNTFTTHNCQIDWGDGSVELGSMSEAAGSGTCEGSHNYVSNGDYTVRVEVCNGVACVQREQRRLVLNVAPTVDAPVLDPAAPITNQPFVAIAAFSDPGTADTHTCTVDYGDGSEVNDGFIEDGGCRSFPHRYFVPGDYTVTVRVCDGDGGCRENSATFTVANAVPEVDAPVMEPAPSSEGAGVVLTASFMNLDSSVSNTCEIDWGDGSVPEAGTVTQHNSRGSCTGEHTYADDGDYTVNVEICGGGQCDQADTQHTVDNVAPTVQLPQLDPATVTQGAEVTASANFNDSGVDDTHTCTVDYGDGSGPQDGVVDDGVCTGPAQSYPDAGDYTVTLRVCDSDGGCSQVTIGHSVGNVGPTIANVENNGPIDEGGTVTITVMMTDTDDNDALTFSFDCDDSGDHETPGNGNQGTCAFSNDGTFDVGVLVEYGGGSDISSTSVIVENAAPTVETPLIDPAAPKWGQSVVASAAFSDPGTEDTHTCTVDYGDGAGPQGGVVENDTCTGPGNTYAAYDTYTVTVEVCDDNGSCQSSTAGATVARSLPTVMTPALDPAVPTEGQSVVASAVLSDLDIADTLTCTVDYGDGAGPQSGVVDNSVCTGPAHSYADDGTYTVAVEVCDDSDDCQSATADATVANVAPTVNTPELDPAAPAEGQSVVASAGFSDPGNADTHTCSVDYGDGSNEQDGVVESGVCSGPAHSYATEGQFSVTVEVCDDDGGCGQQTVSLEIANAAPVVDVPSVSPAPSDEGGLVTVTAGFHDSGNDESHTCAINWGDGTVESGQVEEDSAGATSCAGSHTFIDDDPAGYFIIVEVCDDRGSCGEGSAAHSVRNLPPIIDDIETNAPVPNEQPVTITVTASDPGIADTLSYHFDCDNDGVYETAGSGNQGVCQLDTAAASATIIVLVEDGDGGETTGSVTVDQTLTLCANRYTGALSRPAAGGSCPSDTTTLSVPGPNATTFCISPYTGAISWTPAGLCGTGSRTYVVPDDGPLHYCQSLYTGQLRYSATGACSAGERPGVIPGTIREDENQ